MTTACQFIRRDEQTTTTWSGGTTSQIAIYPQDAKYRDKNFIWRLSTATVDIEESTFTPLPGLSRVLMMMEGNMTLLHEGHHRADLRPFEYDRFSGNWTTRSIGRGRDFNLMHAEGCHGELQIITLGHQDEYYEYLAERETAKRMWITFYCSDESVQVDHDNQSNQLHQGDLLLIHRHRLKTGVSITIRNDGELTSHVIRSVVTESPDATPIS